MGDYRFEGPQIRLRETGGVVASLDPKEGVRTQSRGRLKNEIAQREPERGRVKTVCQG